MRIADVMARYHPRADDPSKRASPSRKLKYARFYRQDVAAAEDYKTIVRGETLLSASVGDPDTLRGQFGWCGCTYGVHAAQLGSNIFIHPPNAALLRRSIVARRSYELVAPL